MKEFHFQAFTKLIKRDLHVLDVGRRNASALHLDGFVFFPYLKLADRYQN